MILLGSYVYYTTNALDTIEGLFVPFARVGSSDPVRALTSTSQQIHWIQLKVYLYRLHV